MDMNRSELDESKAVEIIYAYRGKIIKYKYFKMDVKSDEDV